MTEEKKWTMMLGEKYGCWHPGVSGSAGYGWIEVDQHSVPHSYNHVCERFGCKPVTVALLEEDLSAPELETEYDGNNIRIESWEYQWWTPARGVNGGGLVAYEDMCCEEIDEIIDGFLPSQVGSVWKENEDREPEKTPCVTFHGEVLVGHPGMTFGGDCTFDRNLTVARPELLEFAREMSRTYEKHYPQKGDSWKSVPIDDLHRLLHKVIHDYWYDDDEPCDRKDFIDIANVAMMLWHRLGEDE